MFIQVLLLGILFPLRVSPLFRHLSYAHVVSLKSSLRQDKVGFPLLCHDIPAHLIGDADASGGELGLGQLHWPRVGGVEVRDAGDTGERSGRAETVLVETWTLLLTELLNVARY